MKKYHFENKIKQTEKLMKYLDRDEKLELMLDAFVKTIIEMHDKKYDFVLDKIIKMMANEIKDEFFERTRNP